ncbi:MAG: hypothetical protein IT165_20270 [Bryobacterales bacterium]|nr:hypothetical protein [Bryobacterales bacterium]
MFTIRTIFPDQSRVEVSHYELIPSHEQGQAVCALFLEFLSERPTEFREKLSFLKKGDTELEWTAASGGTALASFYEEGHPISMGVLLSGIDAESDTQMRGALKQSVLEPIFGEEAGKYLIGDERPLMLNVIFPGAPELNPRTQLLAAALASVYFRVMLQLHAEMHGHSTDTP